LPDVPRAAATLATGLALVAALVGCGGAKTDDPAELAPARSIVYAQAALDPEGDQEAAVRSLIERFPGSGDPGQRIQRLLERALRETDSKLSYGEDVKPWLGDSAALFVSGIEVGGEPADAAALIEAKDDGKARDAVEKAAGRRGEHASYEGKDYTRFGRTAAGTVEGFLVVGTEDGFKAAVDASKGDALSDSDAYHDALEKARDDRLAIVFVNSPELLRSAPGFQAQALRPFRRFFGEPYLATVNADPEGVNLESPLPRSLSALVGPFFGQGTAVP
jgi:hypothetical protein